MAVGRSAPIDAAKRAACRRRARDAANADAAGERGTADQLTAEAPPRIIGFVVIDDCAILAQVVFIDIAEAARAVPDAFAMVSAADRINRGAHFIEKANGIAEAASRRSRAAVAGIDDRDRDIGIFAAGLRCTENRKSVV